MAGDLILVDPGSYNAFTIDGSSVSDLSVLASSGSFTINPASGAPEIIVRNVPAGSSVTIQGVDISYADPSAPAVFVHDNAGAVRLSELVIDEAADMSYVTQQAVVEVEDTATFWLTDSSIWSATLRFANSVNPLVASGISNDGVSALQLTDSEGIVQNSRLKAYENDDLGFGNTGYGGDGLRAIGESTSVWLLQDVIGTAYQAQFIGGNGKYGGHAVHQVRSQFAQGRISSCGKSDNAISLVYGQGAQLHGGGAMGGFYGWNNTNNSMPSGGGGGVAFLMVKHCTDDGRRNETTIANNVVPIGGALEVKLRTRLARDYIVGFSYVTDYTMAIPGLTGRSITDGSTFATMTGTSVAQTVTTLTLPCPNNSALIGRQFVVQAGFGPPGTATYDNLGLPALGVIGP